jgi:hypothetical protein
VSFSTHGGGASAHVDSLKFGKLVDAALVKVVGRGFYADHVVKDIGRKNISALVWINIVTPA